MIANSLSLTYDLSGNMIITVPKSYLQDSGQKILLKSLEKIISSAVKKTDVSEDWDNDPAADVVGICKSDTDNGSVSHDRYIYGL
jgi:hypothetical protein